MLLIWLVLIPSVAAFVCKSACELCAMGTNQDSAACALCRDCKSSENRRMMDFTHRKPTLSDQQKEDLKELEKLEFKKVMQEYGLKPEDLIDDNDAMEWTPNLRQQTDPTPCDIGPFTKSCFITNSREPQETKKEDEDEDANESPTNSGKDELLTGKTKTKTKAKGKEQRYKKNCLNNCSPPVTPRRPRTARPTSTRCPPVTPCKNALKMITQQGQSSSTLSPYAYILNNVVTLSDSDYDLNDQGCPTQPICSDDKDYEMRVTKRESVRPTKIITKTWCPEKLFKMLTTSTTTPPCVPCMPFCQLPCVIMPQTPFLPTQETLTEKYTNERSEENNPILPKEEMTKTSSVGTTKDYIYVYVGVPKDVKHLRKG
ncbi:uncharacterized protein LOC134795835 [Cydia splendana]|uniref:uncharacterized protein LOC134795835 n=1 Tax=Cydia splendana TaxID=1100963 RepID=UPI00300D207F